MQQRGDTFRGNAGSTSTLLWIVAGVVVLADATSAALGYRKKIRQ